GVAPAAPGRRRGAGLGPDRHTARLLHGRGWRVGARVRANRAAASHQPVRSVGHGGGAPRAGTRGGGDGAERATTIADRGRVTADATQLVGNVLAAYGLGLVGQATVKLFASGFYAMRDTRTPVKIATSSLVVSTALAWLLMRWLGAPGIALGSSLGVFLNT